MPKFVVTFFDRLITFDYFQMMLSCIKKKKELWMKLLECETNKMHYCLCSMP